LQKTFSCPARPGDESRYSDPAWKSVLCKLNVDCRVLSYDQFCAPPQSAFSPGGAEDGAVRPLIERLIDMGVDVLNPLQPNAADMKPESLKSEFGDRLSFHGGIDIMELLPKGTEAQVKSEAQRMMSNLGRGGGYILASSHHIQADTPLSNVLACTTRRFGACRSRTCQRERYHRVLSYEGEPMPNISSFKSR
jgi:hypothetical protein